jgi:SMC interacting uncharacterized protein involved in chromosome segregation
MTDTDFDFGFTAVDEAELNLPSTPVPSPQPVITSDTLAPISAKLAELDTKISNALKTIPTTQLTRVEEKIDKVLNMELHELNAALQSQGENLSSVLDEVEERSNAVRDECKAKLLEIEGMILPLLTNLMKNPQKEYIHWPSRAEKIQAQIDRITKATRTFGA